MECVQELVALDGVWSRRRFGVIEGGENIISGGLCWVSIEFLVSGRVG